MTSYDEMIVLAEGTNILKWLEESMCQKCTFHGTPECTPNVKQWASAADDKHRYSAECFKIKEDI